MNPTKERNGDLCEMAMHCCKSGTSSLSDFPSLLKKIIQTRAWKLREYRGKVFELPSLLDMVTRKPLEGWGEDPKRIEALIRDDPEALEMWRGEVTRDNGGDRRSDSFRFDNIKSEKPKTGTSKSHSLSVLKRKAPDMFQAVCNGELSANAAMIAAGLRKPVVTVSSDPASALKTLKSKFGDEFIRELKRILNN